MANEGELFLRLVYENRTHYFFHYQSGDVTKENVVSICGHVCNALIGAKIFLPGDRMVVFNLFRDAETIAVSIDHASVGLSMWRLEDLTRDYRKYINVPAGDFVAVRFDQGKYYVYPRIRMPTPVTGDTNEFEISRIVQIITAKPF